jgi:hypothetical protein
MARFSNRSLEGEILIDHRDSPGMTPAQAGSWLAVAGGTAYESAIYTCGHCRFMVVIEPKRTRQRAWCGACAQYLCDDCEGIRHVTLRCHSAAQRRDQCLEARERMS